MLASSSLPYAVPPLSLTLSLSQLIDPDSWDRRWTRHDARDGGGEKVATYKVEYFVNKE